MNDETQIAANTWRVSPDMMCIMDAGGRFTAVNPAWQNSLGWRQEEMIGRTYLDFLHPDDVERSIEGFEVLLSGKPILRFENRYRTNEEGYRWFSWVAVPEADHFFCTVRDITDDKEKVSVITEQRAEAELREQFLAILGHDLRNPLAALQSGLSILGRRTEDSDQLDIMAQMRNSAGRMSELIDNMIDFARVRLGDGIGLNLEPTTELPAHIDQVVQEMRLTFPERSFETSIAISKMVNCDVARIKEVVSNLLSNAITHGKDGGKINVRGESFDDRIEISVCNSGVPVPDAARERMFQPFFRGDVRSSQQGLGLGLYISSEIIAAHGGKLEFTSDETETCFIIIIPTD